MLTAYRFHNERVLVDEIHSGQSREDFGAANFSKENRRFGNEQLEENQGITQSSYARACDFGVTSIPLFA